MKVDVFGRYQLLVERIDERWVVERLDLGKRRFVPEIVIPAHLGEDEIVSYLADLLHESARPGFEIRRLP